MKKLILIVIIVLVVLWGYGFIRANIDVSNGISLFEVAMISRGMNPIARRGYLTYFKNNTDLMSRLNSI